MTINRIAAPKAIEEASSNLYQPLQNQQLTMTALDTEVAFSSLIPHGCELPPAWPPPVDWWEVVVVAVSGGIDSLAMLLSAVEKYPRTKIIVVFNNTQDDHTSNNRLLLGQQTGMSTEMFVRSLCHELNLPLIITTTNSLLELTRKRGKWASSKARYCTSDLKRATTDVVLRNLDFLVTEVANRNVLEEAMADEPELYQSSWAILPTSSNDSDGDKLETTDDDNEKKECKNNWKLASGLRAYTLINKTNEGVLHTRMMVVLAKKGKTELEFSGLGPLVKLVEAIKEKKQLEISNTGYSQNPQANLTINRVLLITGELAEESPARAKKPEWQIRPGVSAPSKGRLVLWHRPMLHWTKDEEIKFITARNFRPAPYYSLGFKRLSCRFCFFLDFAQQSLAFICYPFEAAKFVECEVAINHKVSLDYKFDKYVGYRAVWEFVYGEAQPYTGYLVSSLPSPTNSTKDELEKKVELVENLPVPLDRAIKAIDKLRQQAENRFGLAEKPTGNPILHCHQ